MRRKQIAGWLVAAVCGVVLLAPGLAEAVMVTIQPSSQDTWARPGVPTTNYGNSAELYVLESNPNSNWYMQSFIQFDLPVIPAADTIQNAQLRLYNNAITWASRADGTVSVLSITEPWIEGNGGSDDDPLGELVWNNKPANDPTALDDILFLGGVGSGNSSYNPNEWREWDVTDAVSDWHAGAAPNYGLLLTKGSGGSLHVHFRSNNYGDPSLHPMLVVTHVPEPGTMLLLAGGLAALAARRRRRK